MNVEESMDDDIRVAGAQDESALGVVMAGVSMLLSQSIIVTNPFFDEAEIKRYLTVRRQFHEQFTKACTDLADAFEDGLYGPQAKSAAPALRSIAQLSPKQDKQALRLLTRTLRGLKNLTYQDVVENGGSNRLLRVIRHSRSLDQQDPINEDRIRKYDNYAELIEEALRLPEIPAPMKTLFRKVLKNRGGLGPVETKIDERVNVGAWFDMGTEERDNLRKLAEKLLAQQTELFKTEQDPEKRLTAYREIQERLRRVVNAAGVNLKIVSGEDQEPLEALLKREAKLEMDGPTEFILRKVEEYVRKWGTYRSRGRGKEPSKDDSVPREVGKVLTQLKKAKTFSTVERVVKEAIQRGILSESTLEDLQGYFQEAGKNRGIREGKRLAPIAWEPKTVEQFQAEHNAGKIEFDESIPEKDRAELLGRVSRAVSDLEGIFGKGFCGKHAKKLAFRFGGGSAMAKAHYFAWDDKTEWQPRVTFGEDYEGVLAHELSHYFEDLLSYRISKVEDPERTKEQERRGYGVGMGVVFGNTGVPLERFGAEGTLTNSRDRIGRTVPELVEFIDVVLSTKDYQRWCDYIGSGIDMAIPRAIENLTGQSVYDLPKDHPYYKATDAKFKSELPPELVAEAEKVYRKMMDGDDRKLNYYQSAVEIWARMCEQYVYNKLIQAGVSNPWLTWMTYDDDKYMDEKTFDEKLMPVMDRIFAALGTKNILAARRLVARYLRQLGGPDETVAWSRSSPHPQ